MVAVEFMVTASTGESVKVQSDNWMMAMGKAMNFFALDATSMGRWVITPGPKGEVSIEDPVRKASWTVRPLDMVVRVVAVRPTTEVPLDDDDIPVRREPTGEIDPADLPPPPLAMPTKSQLEAPAMPAPTPLLDDDEEWDPIAQVARPKVRRHETSGEVFSSESVAERLFDLSMDIAGAPPEEACQRALELALEFVPCEAGSVLKGTVADFELTIVAATGPIADQLRGRKIAYGTGLVGLCYDANTALQVNDAHKDARHLAEFDETYGFRTRDVLCVPVSNADGIFGVIQLINPSAPFAEEQVIAVQTIAQTLASALSEAS